MHTLYGKQLMTDHAIYNETKHKNPTHKIIRFSQINNGSL